MRSDAADAESRTRPRAAARGDASAGGRGEARPGDRARVDHLPRHHARASRAAARGVRPARRGGLRARLLAGARRPRQDRLHDPQHAEGGRRAHSALHGARRGHLFARLRRARAGLDARGRRALEAAREHLSLGQHRARERARAACRPDGDRHLGGDRRRGDQALRLHALRSRPWNGRPLPARRSVLPELEGARARLLGRVRRAGRQGQPVTAVLLRREDRAHAQRRRQVGPRLARADPRRVLQGGRRRPARVTGAEDHLAAARPRPATSATTTRTSPSWPSTASGARRSTRRSTASISR